MVTPRSTVHVCQLEQSVTFQVVGWGRMKQSLPVRRRAERALAGGAQALRVDLRHCTYLDSTFLGTLLFLQRSAQCRPGRQFALICPSPECLELFHQMGIDGVFPTEATEEPAACCWEELAGAADDACECQSNVLQAHQELANLGGRAGEIFGDVARRLSREVGPGQGADVSF